MRKMIVLASAVLMLCGIVAGCGDTESNVDQCKKYCDMVFLCDTVNQVTAEGTASCKDACEAAEDAESGKTANNALTGCADYDDCTDFNLCTQQGGTLFTDGDL